MIFRLIEDVSDEYIINDILDTLKKTSEIVQQTIGLEYDDAGNLTKPTPAELRSDRSFSILKWSEASRVAGADDMVKLIYAYTSTYAVHSFLENDVVNKLRDMDIWIHIMSELGFSDDNNPFVTYVRRYKNFNIDFMRSQLITLNNLYSEKVFNRTALEDINSILYNPNIWLLSEEDAESIIRNYFYVMGHHKNYNPDVQPTTGDHKRIKDRVDAHLDKMENYIVFINGGPVNVSGDIEKAWNIQDFINKYFVGGVTNKSETKKESEQEKEEVTLDRDKKAVIDKAIADGNLKYSDIAGINAYFKELYDTGSIR